MPRHAAAQEPECPYAAALQAEPGATRVGNAERMAFLRARMELGARRSRAWSFGWGITYGAAAVALAAAIPFLDKGTRIDLAFGLASTATGVLARAVSRPYVFRAVRRVRKIDGHTCVDLHTVELELVRAAEWERRGRRWFLHLAAFTYSVGMGLTLGLAFKRPVQGNRQTAIGGTVGQMMLVTQPMVMVDTLEHYRQGDVVTPPRSMSIAPLMHPGAFGLSMAGTF